jgi:hypothetical protein
MSTDPSGAAIGRLDAAVDEDSQDAAATVPSRALADLAAAIERVEALVASGAAQGPDRSAALERIADIAFVLHEREVEASLCDALDAAVREISEAGGLKQTSGQSTHEAAELLRDLSRRVNELIARAQVEQRAAAPEAAKAEPAARHTERANAGKDDGEDVADDDMLEAGLFEPDLPEDDEFAQVVAALTASLPTLADSDEPQSDAPSETAAGNVPQESMQPMQPPAGHAEVAAAAAPVFESPLSDTGLEAALADESARAVFPSEPASVKASQPPSASEDSTNAVVLALPAPDAFAPMTATETPPQSTPETFVGPDPVLVTPADDSHSESRHAAPGEPSEPLAQERADFGPLTVERSAPFSSADDDGDELFADTTHNQATAEAVARGAGSDDAPRPPAEEESSRTLPPESQRSIDPSDDPGDLFEPMADAPTAAQIPVSPHSAPPGGAEAKSSLEISASDRASSPPSIARGHDVKPQVPPVLPASPPSTQPRATAAVPRPAANDPLAAVRTLSEEEMIALFT